MDGLNPSEVTKLNIFSYNSYRQLLKDFYEHKKQSRTTFSHRRFAQLADIRSSNYLYLVMNNKRNLSTAMSIRVAKAMALSREEAQYFVDLVANENINRKQSLSIPQASAPLLEG